MLRSNQARAVDAAQGNVLSVQDSKDLLESEQRASYPD
jgi:hypothetical protein